MTIDRQTKRFSPSPRRRFLAASAALGATLWLPAAARGASVRALQGAVRINGTPATSATRVQSGDLVETGPDSRIVFVVGQDAFLLRARSTLKLRRPTSSGKTAVAGLHLEAGALLAVFGAGSRLIETAAAKATAGPRATGVYLEAGPEQTYFCTCYGEVELRDKAGGERKVLISSYHSANLIYAKPVNGRLLAVAPVQDHTDAELTALDALLGRTSPLVARAPKRPGSASRSQRPAAAQPAVTKESAARREQQPPAAQPGRAASPGPVALPAPEPQSTPQAVPATEELRLPPARLDD